MAGATRDSLRTLAIAALMLGAVMAGWGQMGKAAKRPILPDESTGSITGKLTDLYSNPLDGVTVVLRNEATGAEMRATTSKSGSYRFTGLAAGEYTLEAESAQWGQGRLEGLLVSAGHEARVQTAMDFGRLANHTIELASHTVRQETQAPHPPEDRLAEGNVPPPSDHNLPTETAAIDAPIAPQTLQRMNVAGRSLPALVQEIPSVSPPKPVATLSKKPTQKLPLRGRGKVHPALPTMAAAKDNGWRPDSPLVAQAIRSRALASLSPAVQPVQPALDFNQTLALSVALAAEPQSSPLTGALQPKDSVALAHLDVDPVTPVVTTTLAAEQIEALPVGGRRWQDFVLDTPTAAAPAGGTMQTSLRGAGALAAETTVDGANTRLVFGGQGMGSPGQAAGDPSGMGQAWSGGRGFAVGEAAIGQIKTVAGNLELEGVRSAGGGMNLETRRGANGLHGQGFLFDRQNVWGAMNPFTQWVKETTPATVATTPTFTPQPYTPPDHEASWGIGLGSQLRRDKLFWFAALDSYHRNDPGLATVKHPAEFFAQPSNDQMQVLSARLGLSSKNPVAAGLAAYSSLLGTLAGLLGPAQRTATQWVGFGRLDWEAAERHRFTLEGIGATWDSPGGGLTRVSQAYGTNSFGSSEASEEWLLGRWEAFLTPNLMAVTQGSMGRQVLVAHAEAPSAFEKTFLAPSSWGQLPQMVVDSRYGLTIGNPSRFGAGSYPDERLYEAQEKMDWVRGALLVKAGFDLSHNSDATSLLRNQTGTYSYSSVENFASDALAFAAFGVSGQLQPANQHNCDETGKVWRDSAGTLRGLGYLPCYSYYSQTMGPTNWNLSTNDWAGYATAQWQPKRRFVLSAGVRWEREQLPPPIAALANPALPLTATLPSLGNNWAPRLSLALGNAEGHWPVLRLGYGMYFGRTENAALETALTHTGSTKGDLNFFLRPTDNLHTGGAPPFPYVLSGEPLSMVKPGAVEFAPRFHNPEVHQGVAGVEESLPGHVELTASGLVSLGRRLPISVDSNFDPKVNPGTITYGVVDGTGAGPIKATRLTVPFYASWPSATSATGFAGRLDSDYQQISEIIDQANSTYEAAMVKVARNSRRGLSLHAHYTYAHAMDWNPNESPQVAGSNVLDPAHFSQEYGVSNLDVRHSAAAMAIYNAPWKLQGLAGKLADGWMLSGVAQFKSGLPFTMRTSGSLAEEFNQTTGAAIVALAPGMNGSGGDNRVYGVGRNTYRYPSTWKADMRLAKSFDLGHSRQLELLMESFNLFNHQNVTELETTGYYIEPGSLSGSFPTLNFLTGLKPNTTAFGQPLNINATDFYRERQMQVGLRFRF